MRAETLTGGIRATSTEEPSELERMLRRAAKRLLARRAASIICKSLPPLVFALALYAAVIRFTLLDIPVWPAALIFIFWATLATVLVASNRVTPFETARFLDKKLGLDERVSTYVQIRAVTRNSPNTAQRRALLETIRKDAVNHLQARADRLPGYLPGSLPRPQLALAVLGLVLFAAALTVPSPLDAVRLERLAVQAALREQLGGIEILKTELLARNDLPRPMLNTLISELDNLAAKLEAGSADRSQLLAGLAESQSKLRDLLPNSVAEFGGLNNAAALVQEGALTNSEWEPQEGEEHSALGFASSASVYLSSVASSLAATESRSLALYLERAAAQVGTRDLLLGQGLKNASGAIRTQDGELARSSLQTAARRFRDLEAELSVAQSVESVLSKLDEGRRTVADAGKNKTSRPQVGFRRQGAPTSSDASAGEVLADETLRDPNQVGNSSAQQGVGPKTSGGALSFGSLPKDSSGSPGSASEGSGNGGTDTDPSGMGANPNAGGSSAGGTGRPGVPGAGDAGATGGSTGGAGGVGSQNGTITQVPNPSGNGRGVQGDSASGADSQEEIYAPASESSGGQPEVPTEGAGGTDSSRTDGIDGRAEGGDGEPVARGEMAPGTLKPLYTPYTEIIGEYAERATRALDRAYIPADAKEYVKSYFTELGK